jgi:hypothetical protein
VVPKEERERERGRSEEAMAFESLWRSERGERGATLERRRRAGGESGGDAGREREARGAQSIGYKPKRIRV